MPRNQLLEVRAGTAAQWAAANPVLATGEPGYETDTGNIKIGDGVTAWTSLANALHGAYVSRAGGTSPTPAPLPGFNVKDYGAKGDGTTDDTAAIQAAINAAVSAGGGVVFAPLTPNGYGGSTTINVPANVKLIVNNSTFPPLHVLANGQLIQNINGTTYSTSGASGFGYQFNSFTAQDVVSTYRKFPGGTALYAEDSTENPASVPGQIDQALRIERHNGGPTNGATSIGADLYDFVSGNSGIGPMLRVHALNAGGNPEVLINNTNQTTPNAPFVALLIQDLQQAGSPSNCALQLSVYQDSVSGFQFLDGQRSQAVVANMTKDASGAYFDLNNASGVNRIRLKASVAGSGYLRLWDDGASTYQYASIHNGAWVISTSEPT